MMKNKKSLLIKVEILGIAVTLSLKMATLFFIFDTLSFRYLKQNVLKAIWS